MRKTLCDQSTISNTLKRSSEYFSKEEKNSNVKRHKSAKYPKLENVLESKHEWRMIQTKAKEFLQKMYGDANSKFNFSIGWLEQFKARHGIKSYRRFGESGSVFMKNIEDALPQIRAKLENFDWKDIYNVDETGLFYRLQANYSLAAKQFEGRKRARKNLLLWFVAMRMVQIKCLFGITGRKVLLIVYSCPAHPKEDMSLKQEIGDFEGIHKLKEVIYDLHYRNAMDVEQILNYPSENESLIESPTNEEIIQGVMDVPAEDNSVLPHFSLKEAFLTVDTLKNYLIQHEKNIPDLVYALLKVKDEIIFDSHAKKELTIDAYFSKE
ncbi:hypothetical protein CXB51_034161 [Gossypium anomalum]|uniref:HTH CENPB-type domain-containing protein n=1 Tax=Gossypium anomalum TaxID=47600 RepID=A0A8J5Y038_9ROSI|nr:hypothetical protein CXB51_034161 [Gossypium anomalum]